MTPRSSLRVHCVDRLCPGHAIERAADVPIRQSLPPSLSYGAPPSAHCNRWLLLLGPLVAESDGWFAVCLSLLLPLRSSRAEEQHSTDTRLNQPAMTTAIALPRPSRTNEPRGENENRFP